METGRPMLINDDDCDAEYPESLKEEEAVGELFHPQRPTILQTTVYLTRLLQPLSHLCRSLCIPLDAIRTFEMHLGACMQMFPPELQLGVTTPLDPLWMAPLIYFQNTRIILHRHNLSPACSPEQRALAIKNCATAAEDTAAVFARCFDMQAPYEHVQERLRMAATNLICTHTWRCLLFLSFCQLWGPFHTLLRFASIVADAKLVNISCGRYLSLFLDRLIERHQQDARWKLEEDAELIVLVSGDLQAGPAGWAWNTKEPIAPLNQRQKSASQTPATTGTSEFHQSPERFPSWDTMLSESEKQRWGGWDKVTQAAQYLERLQNTRQTQPSLPVKPFAGSNTENRMGPRRTESDRGTGTTKSRMTIASITDQ